MLVLSFLRSAPASPTHGMMMPPAFVPVRTPEESRSPHPATPEVFDIQKPKASKAASSPLKAKSPFDIAKQSIQMMSPEEKSPIGQKSVIIQQQQQQQQQQIVRQSAVSVIRPQTANVSSSVAQNGYSSNIAIERKPVITNPKVESERIQNSFSGKSYIFCDFCFVLVLH